MAIRLIAIAIALPIISFGCARTWVNYPPQLLTGKDGVTRSVASRALELNGSDSLGATDISVTRDGVKFASAGGIDNSTSTKEGYATARAGITAAGTIATAGFAYGAYAANQSATAASNAAASKASAASNVAASRASAATAAVAAREAARAAAPAAGSTINAITPATVVPIIP